MHCVQIYIQPHTHEANVCQIHACMPTESRQSAQHFHACMFSCVSKPLFAHQIHLPCLCLVLMSYYHCMSRLGSGEVQRSPYRSLAQGRAAGYESASVTLLLHRMEDQGLQLGGQGATVQAHLSASVPTGSADTGSTMPPMTGHLHAGKSH